MADIDVISACGDGSTVFAGSIAEQKDVLTGLDAEIGDADHGANMHRGMQAVARRDRRASEYADPAGAAQAGRHDAGAVRRRGQRAAVRHAVPAHGHLRRVVHRPRRGGLREGVAGRHGRRRRPRQGRGGRQDDVRRARPRRGRPRHERGLGGADRRRTARRPPRRPTRAGTPRSRSWPARAGPATWASAASGTRIPGRPRPPCWSPPLPRHCPVWIHDRRHRGGLAQPSARGRRGRAGRRDAARPRGAHRGRRRARRRRLRDGCRRHPRRRPPGRSRRRRRRADGPGERGPVRRARHGLPGRRRQEPGRPLPRTAGGGADRGRGERRRGRRRPPRSPTRRWRRSRRNGPHLSPAEERRRRRAGPAPRRGGDRRGDRGLHRDDAARPARATVGAHRAGGPSSRRRGGAAQPHASAPGSSPRAACRRSPRSARCRATRSRSGRSGRRPTRP